MKWSLFFVLFVALLFATYLEARGRDGGGHGGGFHGAGGFAPFRQPGAVMGPEFTAMEQAARELSDLALAGGVPASGGPGRCTVQVSGFTTTLPSSRRSMTPLPTRRIPTRHPFTTIRNLPSQM